MAQAYLTRLGGNRFVAESAGQTIGALTAVEIEVMAEDGLATDRRPNSVFSLFNEGRTYDFIVTVCDNGHQENCTTYPGNRNVIVWQFADPATFRGTRPERIAKTRAVRDEIKNAVEAFIAEAAVAHPVTPAVEP